LNLTQETGPHSPSAAAPSNRAPEELPPGTCLLNRFEILQTLGFGGMGVVYKARDREFEKEHIDRIVALKVIRPDLVNRPSVIRHFHQEILLAQRVSHPNVVRIYDFMSGEGRMLFTMEYIEGENLAALLNSGKRFTCVEAAKIMYQVARGLETAHAENVVHRDLKPTNIMVRPNGRVAVMDFGLAFKAGPDGDTQTMGVGTPAYMSPEQILDQPVDARSDLFSYGLIFYELLTGKAAFQVSSTASLVLRTQKTPTPPHDVDPAIPRELSDLVMKCLAIAPQDRYQSAEEIVEDLRRWSGEAIPKRLSRRRQAVTIAASVIAGVVAALMAVFLVYLVVGKRATPATASVLITDFANTTKDSVFDATLSQMFMVALEGAPFISVYDSAQARRTMHDIDRAAQSLDERLGRLIAARDGVRYVVDGSISGSPGAYVLSVKTEEAVTGRKIAERRVTVETRQDALDAIPKLAAAVRKALGDRTPESKQLEQAETFTSHSVEALHTYAVAQTLQLEGKADDAIQQYTRATELDPNMGRAYAGLAVLFRNRNDRTEADFYFRQALAHMDRMTEREKLRTRGSYYVFSGNPDKAIEELTELVRKYPADNSGLANLAVAYFQKRDMRTALDVGRRAVAIYRGNVVQRNNVALYALYAGDFETATREASEVLQLNDRFGKAYLALALAEMGQDHPDAAIEIYGRLAKLDDYNAARAAIGVADARLYQGQPREAIATLLKAADIQALLPYRKILLAEAYLAEGDTRRAAEAARESIVSSAPASVLVPAARLFAHLGDFATAREIQAQLSNSFGREQRAYALVIEGDVELKLDRQQSAIDDFAHATAASDTWLGRFDSGVAWLAAARYAEAQSDFETALNRRAEALAMFLDDIPTARYIPPVNYYLACALDGLNNAGAVDLYQKYLSIRSKAAHDALADAARQRLKTIAPAAAPGK
jgi:tetratricopeptide (TPR) repeat protein/tRNA A-37 threonylcarbamoyl transferase component Bud32